VAESPVMRVIDCHVARETATGWEYLVLLRVADRLDAGRWRVVTGKIEAGETAWQAALRELREETGLVPTRFLAVPYVNQFYEWQHDRINAIPVFVAVVEATDALELDGEHVECRWLAVDEASSSLAWPGMAEGLRAAHALLSGYDRAVDALAVDWESDSTPGR
jgi:dihydroneopterin triphosphate diphosphatase